MDWVKREDRGGTEQPSFDNQYPHVDRALVVDATLDCIVELNGRTAEESAGAVFSELNNGQRFWQGPGSNPGVCNGSERPRRSHEAELSGTFAVSVLPCSAVVNIVTGDYGIRYSLSAQA